MSEHVGLERVPVSRPGVHPKRRRTGGRVYEFAPGNDIARVWGCYPTGPEPGEVTARLRSATICATDVSNMHDVLGHGDVTGRVAGHESCYEVIDSNRRDIEHGQLVVPLGDDFFGLAEYFSFLPVLPGDRIPQTDLHFELRGAFLDPIEGYKAALLIDEWFSGASLLEPATHVYTSLYYNGSVPNQSILVVGAGLCGQIACHLLRRWGAAKQIVLMDPDNDRLAMAVEAGVADEILNPVEDIELIERLITSKAGAHVDTVFDALPGVLARSPTDSRLLAARLVKPKGRWLMFGATEKVDFPLLPLLSKAITVKGSPFDSRILSFEQRATFMKKTYGLAKRGIIPLGSFIKESVDFVNEEQVTSLFRSKRSGRGLRVEIIGPNRGSDRQGLK